MVDSLERMGYSADSIHGDKSQALRSRVLEYFRKGTRDILVATDVAARGLDVKDVEVVINYSFPNSVEDYVHRIGRTARGDRSGISYTLMTPRDSRHAKELVGVLRRCGQDVPEKLLQMSSYSGSGGSNRGRGSGGFPQNRGRGYGRAQVGGGRGGRAWESRNRNGSSDSNTSFGNRFGGREDRGRNSFDTWRGGSGRHSREEGGYLGSYPSSNHTSKSAEFDSWS
eukprot:gene140-140_t